jgi:hypothetical protein
MVELDESQQRFSSLYEKYAVRPAQVQPEGAVNSPAPQPTAVVAEKPENVHQQEQLTEKLVYNPDPQPPQQPAQPAVQPEIGSAQQPLGQPELPAQSQSPTIDQPQLETQQEIIPTSTVPQPVSPQVPQSPAQPNRNKFNPPRDLTFEMQHAGKSRRSQILKRLLVVLFLLAVTAGITVGIIFFDLVSTAETGWTTLQKWIS